ncbi:MAG: YkgJ family cysteine cluster protein [Desulfovibrionaceae bacterium]|nr:YkgJ family cysteine cluster protein [Desulfovibrionaceae bacterium]
MEGKIAFLESRLDPMYCMRCGTCCRSGGPILHEADLVLFSNGILSAEDVVVFRKGETVYDERIGDRIRLDEEFLRIAPPDGAKAGVCRFLDAQPYLISCLVYDRRPVQCQDRRCSNLPEILRRYSDSRICREDLFSVLNLPESWMRLSRLHETVCSGIQLAEYADAVRSENSIRALDAKDAIVELVQYDKLFRSAAVDRHGVSKAALKLLFGRAFSDVLIGMRIEYRECPQHGAAVSTLR